MDSSSCRLDELNKEIYALREDRNKYFNLHPNATEQDRNEEISSRADSIYKEALWLDDVSSVKYLIGGMALNLTEEYDMRCEDALSTAVRMSPSDPLAWNELAQCISKRGDDTSLVCSLLTSSLSLSRSAPTLALLSISIRATLSSLTPEEAVIARAESLSLARQSVQMDDSCADGWMSLANALLSVFFFDGQKNMHQLDESIESYERALRNGLDDQSDVHLNLSTALRYQCHLEKSLIHLEKAYDCDRSSVIREQLHEYISILKKMDESIEDASGKSGEMRIKENEPVTGTIVKMCTPPSFTPSLLLLSPSSSSSSSSPIIVALLNCSSSLSLLVGDIISIPSFQLLQYSNGPLLRVISPSTLLRNGRTLRDSCLAMASVSIE